MADRLRSTTNSMHSGAARTCPLRPPRLCRHRCQERQESPSAERDSIAPADWVALQWCTRCRIGVGAYCSKVKGGPGGRLRHECRRRARRSSCEVQITMSVAEDSKHYRSWVRETESGYAADPARRSGPRVRERGQQQLVQCSLFAKAIPRPPSR